MLEIVMLEIEIKRCLEDLYTFISQEQTISFKYILKDSLGK